LAAYAIDLIALQSLDPEPPIVQFPPPSEEALQVSHQLAARVREEIAQQGGWIPFDRYMQRVLYEPGLGYYSAGSVKLGPAGDFVTAPELSPAFGRLLAAEIVPWLMQLEAPAIVELGAGTGALAEQLLNSLQMVPGLRYQILEPGADLRERQQQRLAGFGERVTWLDALPAEPMQAVVIANEVADALPVACFATRGGQVMARGVSVSGERFHWAERPADQALMCMVEALADALGGPFADGYRSEICRMLPPWIASLAGSLSRGAVLLIDYGLVRHEYYHPARRDGTLICHYRHRAHEDPFLWPGLQDLTAWVDFSACADAAVVVDMEVSGFTTQGQFLVERAAQDPGALADASPADLAAFKTLILPGEMGERFKLLLLNRGLRGCRLSGRDLRGRL
jgi:SAM-dependent MidA family methyltransferase